MRERAAFGSQSREHLLLDVLIEEGGADRRPRGAEAVGVAAGAVVDRVALPVFLLGVAGDLERVAAAGAADQPAQHRLCGERAIARLQQRLRRLGGVELGPA